MTKNISRRQPQVRVEDREIVFYYLTKSEILSLKANTIIGDVFFAVGSIVFGAAFALDGPVVALFIIVAMVCWLVSFVYYWLRNSLTKDINVPRSPSISTASKEEQEPRKSSASKQNTDSRILEAHYGAEGTWIDVTARLREAMTAGGTVLVSNGLAGQDPLPSTVKFLRVQYEYNNETWQKDYKEGSPVELPPGVS